MMEGGQLQPIQSHRVKSDPLSVKPPSFESSQVIKPRLNVQSVKDMGTANLFDSNQLI